MERRIRRHAARLVDECEELLRGEVADRVSDEVLPPWIWVNLLAHGTEEQLRSDAARLRRSRGWRQARAFLSGEIIDLVDRRGVELEELQREVLVPLEVELLIHRFLRPTTRGKLVADVVDALQDHVRRSKRRPATAGPETI